MSNRARSALPLLWISLSVQPYAYTGDDNINTLYRELTLILWKDSECLTFN